LRDAKASRDDVGRPELQGFARAFEALPKLGVGLVFLHKRILQLDF
jgi:hypothetical protein